MLTESEFIECSNAAALFIDFDGTLVDTNGWHLDAYNSALETYGLHISSKQYHSNIGGGGIAVITRIADQNGWSIPVEQVVEEKYAIYRRYVDSRHPTVNEQLTRLLHQFEGRALVVSDGQRSVIERLLARTQTDEYFDAIVSREDVTMCKPAPDLYTTAMETARCRPEDGVAFEDSDNGERAAVGAGLRCIKRTWFEQ